MNSISADVGREAEHVVEKAVKAQLSTNSRVWVNRRVADDTRNSELDLVVAIPDAGFVCIEVKGGQVTSDGDQWIQTNAQGKAIVIHPVDQARKGMYALQRYVEDDSRWGSRGRVRWAHAVAFPFTKVPGDFSMPDCRRHMVFGRNDLENLMAGLVATAGRQQTGCRKPNVADVEVLAEILHGQNFPQADVIGVAAERDALADRLTEQQGLILDVSRLVMRMEIRGGAGSGKTWLALEQARRLTHSGERVALVCYSRGLAAYFQRVTSNWAYKERPAYVGTFHGLGTEEWGASPPLGLGDSSYWEDQLPSQMEQIASGLAVGKKFDAIVVDEAQDFADAWWPAITSALKDPDQGRLTIMSDEGQRVFARFGGVPECQAVLTLEQNLRNSRQIADTFQELALTRMRNRGGDGPKVRFVACEATEAMGRADDAVDELLDEGWRPKDVALLTVRSRHPEQVARQDVSQDDYWASFWDDTSVFYGHVLGFKGLERRAVVLALNESEPRERAKERLYVGLSRARDCLVVCGDPEYLERVGGPRLRSRLTSGA